MVAGEARRPLDPRLRGNQVQERGRLGPHPHPMRPGGQHTRDEPERVA